jgi:hypothetical protein
LQDLPHWFNGSQIAPVALRRLAIRGLGDAFAFDEDPDLPAFDDQGYSGADIIELITLG